MPNQQAGLLDEASDCAEFLDFVREHNFSQAPVRMGDGSLDLITTNAVARWLASEYKAFSGAAIEHASLGEVLKFSEAGDKVLVRSGLARLRSSESNTTPQALAITHSGKVSEKPLALVVRSYLPSLLKVLL